MNYFSFLTFRAKFFVFIIFSYVGLSQASELFMEEKSSRNLQHLDQSTYYNFFKNYTSGYINGLIAKLPTGFVIGYTPSSSDPVNIQMFDEYGNTIGDPIFSTHSASNLYGICSLSNGGFAIFFVGTDSHYYLSTYDSNGQIKGTNTLSNQNSPRAFLRGLSNGNIVLSYATDPVVAWSGGNAYSLRTSRKFFDSFANLISDDYLIFDSLSTSSFNSNVPQEGSYSTPSSSISPLYLGGFISFSAFTPSATYGSCPLCDLANTYLYIAIFPSGGTTSTNTFSITTISNPLIDGYYGVDVNVATSSSISGGFVVVWETSCTIYAKFFSDSGSQQTSTISVYSNSGSCNYPYAFDTLSVTNTTFGGYLVYWYESKSGYWVSKGQYLTQSGQLNGTSFVMANSMSIYSILFLSNGNCIQLTQNGNTLQGYIFFAVGSAIITNRLTIKQGKTVVLSSLQVNAFGGTPSAVNFVASSVINGFFSYSSASTISISSFTLQDINNGVVEFTHNGGITAPSYTLSLLIGSTQSGSKSATITFYVSPAVKINQITIKQNHTITLTTSNILGVDTGLLLTYQISNLTNGKFQLSSAIGQSITSFTHSQLTNGLVKCSMLWN